jgi:hypothetical protein
MLEFSQTTEGVIAIVLGIYVIVSGLTSKHLISESDIPATEEEKRKATATPARRAIVALIGLAACAYGLYRLIYQVTPNK